MDAIHLGAINYVLQNIYSAETSAFFSKVFIQA